MSFSSGAGVRDSLSNLAASLGTGRDKSILMAEYRHVFERMRVLNPTCASDYDVALDDMSNFKTLSLAEESFG